MSDFLPRCLGDISNFINQGVDINSSSSFGANLPQSPARRLHPSETREPKASRRWACSAATAASPRRPPNPRVPLDEREEIRQETQPIRRKPFSSCLLRPGLRGRITLRWASMVGGRVRGGWERRVRWWGDWWGSLGRWIRGLWRQRVSRWGSGLRTASTPPPVDFGSGWRGCLFFFLMCQKKKVGLKTPPPPVICVEE